MKPKSGKTKELKIDIADSAALEHYLPVKQYPDIVGEMIGHKKTETDDEPKSSGQWDQKIDAEDFLMM